MNSTTHRQYSSGWFYARPGDVPASVVIPEGQTALISDQGEFGYPVYSSGGYSVQLVSPR